MPFHRFFRGFRGPRPSQNLENQSKTIGFLIFSRTVQDGRKTSKNILKRRPGSLQDVPKPPQDPPKTHQDRPKTPPRHSSDPSRLIPDAPRTHQDCSRHPTTLKHASQTLPKLDFLASGSSKCAILAKFLVRIFGPKMLAKHNHPAT